ncbi:MAG: hypothetical protein N2691_01725 [Patescibacteria group bacterium]|nr:hypothetical protein [Patescibacteria group bacterium]
MLFVLALIVLLPLFNRIYVTTSIRSYGNGVSARELDRVTIPIDNPARPVDAVGDFTVEFWMKGTASANTAGTCYASTSSGDGWITGHIMVDRDVYETRMMVIFRRIGYQDRKYLFQRKHCYNR